MKTETYICDKCGERIESERKRKDVFLQMQSSDTPLNERSADLCGDCFADLVDRFDGLLREMWRSRP